MSTASLGAHLQAVRGPAGGVHSTSMSTPLSKASPEARPAVSGASQTQGTPEADRLAADLRALRFSDAHHLGLGDIRLTPGQQDDLVERVRKLEQALAAKDARIDAICEVAQRVDPSVTTLESAWDSVLSELDRAREALAPLAAKADEYEHCANEGLFLTPGLKLADARRARAALRGRGLFYPTLDTIA